MGVYVNPGNTAFQKALNGDIYVDKTNLLTYTNSGIDKTDCYVCVSRPTAFWKVHGGGYACGLLQQRP